MAQTVRLKRSATQGAAPSTSDLALGEVAINTYDGKVYIKKDDGTASIVEVGGAASGAYTKYAYTATASQTTFSVTYAPGYVDVWLNGVKLDTSDYTATSGSSIVLASGATSGDLFEAIAWNIANIQQNAYTKYSYTATASQTTFTASYTQGYVNVYLNGVLLLDSTEYTATNGTSVVLATGATAGDSVVIEAFSTYSTATPTFTGTVTADGLSLGDNDKATFGDSNDLEIYHDGVHTRIDDVGSGSLLLQTNGSSIQLNKGTSENMLVATTDGSVDLYYDNSKKLATTSTGIDVTGGVSIDDDNNYSFGDGTTYIQGSGAADRLKFITNASEAMRIDSSGNVGIGTSTVHADLHLGAASPHIDIGPSAGNRGKVGFDSNNVYIGSTSSTGEIHFKNNIGSTDAPQASGDTKMVITDSGVGIGTTSPSSYSSKAYDLVVLTSADTGISIVSGTSSEGAIVFADGTTGGDQLRGRVRYSHSTDSMDFRVNNNEAMRIDSSGDVGIGVSALETTSSTRTALTIDNSFFAWGRDSYNEAGIAQGSYRNSAGNDEYRTTGVAASQVAFSAGTINLQVAASGTNGNTISWTDGIVVDNSGNVGIGTTSPTDYYADDLVVSAPTEGGITIASTATSNTAYLAFADGTTGDARYRGYIQYNHNTDFMRFASSGSEAMRIDSSGNLLVGHTGSVYNNVNATSTEGISLTTNGEIFACSSQSSGVMILNRKSSDGSILTFDRDGTAVGSIGISSGALQVSGNTNSGLQFNSSSFVPMQNGATIDATIDLGSSVRQFKDLYLSGTAKVNAVTYTGTDGTAGQVLTTDGSGNATFADAGDITGVTAGNGLTGGATSGNATINVGAGTGISVAANTVGLATSGVTAGTYGSASAIPAITVDTYGRVTSASTNSFSAGSLTQIATSSYNFTSQAVASLSIGTSAISSYDFLLVIIDGKISRSGSYSDFYLGFNNASGSGYYIGSYGDTDYGVWQSLNGYYGVPIGKVSTNSDGAHIQILLQGRNNTGATYEKDPLIHVASGGGAYGGMVGSYSINRNNFGTSTISSIQVGLPGNNSFNFTGDITVYGVS